MLVDGAVDSGAKVVPNAANEGLEVTGPDWPGEPVGPDVQGQPISLDPDGELVLDAGTDIAVSAAGFEPESSIDLHVDPPIARGSSNPVWIGAVATDASGNFDGTVELPTQVVGEHVLRLVGFTRERRALAINIGVKAGSWILLDQGTRKAHGRHDRIRATGSSAGLTPGTRMAPWIRYENISKFIPGNASVMVQDDGSFRWTRKVRANRGLAAYVSFEDTTSNRVYWRKVR